MNNEETILDPQYSAESKVNAENNAASKNEIKKSKGNGVAGKIGAAAVGIAAGVVGTMYADDVKAAVLPNSENTTGNTTENTTEEQQTETNSASIPESAPSTHPTHHATQTTNPDPTPNHTVEVVDVTQTDVNGDGQLDDAALLNVDGEAVIIADIDHDGEADVELRDVNGNGQLDQEDVIDVKAEHIAMPNHTEAVPTSQPDESEVDVHVLHVGQADLNGDGLSENVALVDVEGTEVLLVDIEQDGTADVLIRNENGTDHAYDITDEEIDMPTMSDGDMYMTSADSEPDYTNDADIDLFDA